MLRLATWNINSVRSRTELVSKFLDDEQPDILCLQEIKCRDEEFPKDVFEQHGYNHFALHGQKAYHGVATISKVPFVNEEKKKFCGLDDARHIFVEVKGTKGRRKIGVHNFYVPAGGDIPDRNVNKKFGHKLDFLDELTDWCQKAKLAGKDAVLVGDLNIAPSENDVWNHRALLKVVSHTLIEVDKLVALQASGPWLDAVRTKIPEPEKLYSWWSYRSPNWENADKGRRLDHVWLSKKTAGSLFDARVVKSARGWEKPSDHAPIVVDLDL